MKYVVACMAVLGLGLWACGGGGADFEKICEDGNVTVAAVYEECGITTFTETDCSVYGTGYDVCSNSDEIEESFKAMYDGYSCDTATSVVDYDGSTITACTA